MHLIISYYIAVDDDDDFILTVVPVTGEQRVVPREVGPAAELGTVCDEHFLDGLIIVDDDARHGTHGHGVDGPVLVGQLGEPPERPVPVPVHDVHGPDDRERLRTAEHRVRFGRRWTTPPAALGVRDPQQNHRNQRNGTADGTRSSGHYPVHAVHSHSVPAANHRLSYMCECAPGVTTPPRLRRW